MQPPQNLNAITGSAADPLAVQSAPQAAGAKNEANGPMGVPENGQNLAANPVSGVALNNPLGAGANQ